MEIEQFVADRIQELLEKYDISRYQLAQRTGISQTVLGDLVNKKHIPTLTTLLNICNGFQISLEQFFQTKNEWNQRELSDEQQDVLNLWDDLRPDEKRIIKICMQEFKKR